MFKPALPLAASLLALLLSAPVTADDSDFDKPIFVDAKSQFVDGKNKISLFKDDVHIKQGSLTIDADEVEVIATAGDGKEIFIARGNPASYTQKAEDGTVVNAKANIIRYEVSNRTISLSGNAELQQDTSMVKGDTITYDMEKEQLLAQSGEENQGRVTTVFRPEALKALTDEEEQSGDDDNDDQDNEDTPK